MTYLQHFSANPNSRDFVIGDLHGQLDQLKRAMEAHAFDPAVDRLFSLGDLIDRGKDSKACFELLQQPWFHAVRGNHEQMMFDWLAGPVRASQALWLHNGGFCWVPDPDSFFLEQSAFRQLVVVQSGQMPYAIEVALRDGRRVGLVHATCPVKDWSKLQDTLAQSQKARARALWEVHANELFHPAAVAKIDLIAHGHTMVRNPKRRANCVYIDTGAWMVESRIRDSYINNPRLTMLRLEQLFALPDVDVARF